MIDRFQRTIRFEKVKNFSTLTKESWWSIMNHQWKEYLWSP
jgi:hypothetical protein